MAKQIRTDIFHCSIQQFRANMQRIRDISGTKGWLSSDNIRIMFGEYPYTHAVYTTTLSPSGGTWTSIYDWKPNYDKMVDPIKRPPTRASWEVVPWNPYSMRSWWHPQKGMYYAGIEAYEKTDSCTCVDFIDGYSPSQPYQEYLPIGSPFEEFCRMVVEEIQGVAGRRVMKILFLAANPTDTSRLRLGEEFREIQDNIKKALLRDQFKLNLPQLSVRPADISQALLDTQPQIVHFSGHGAPTGALCFESQTGQVQLVQPDALAALFEQFASQITCVLLNACYSEIQAKAIAEHIEYVIGMNKAIGDKAAIAFAIGFYQALGAGRTVEDSYKLGCAQIRLQGIPEHLTPVLIKKKSLDSASSSAVLIAENLTSKQKVQRVSLQAWNGQFVCAVDGGGGEVLANQNDVDEQSIFELIEHEDNRVSLRASNGDYLCAEGGGGREIVANRKVPSAWEIFDLVELGEDRIALRVYRGQYVCAENGGGGAIVADRNVRREWETFRLVRHIERDNVA
jgi:hypothetical protein